MKNIKVNNVNFRGQYGEAYEQLITGKEIDMSYFKNGNWEPTSQVARFKYLLLKANVRCNIKGDSLRTTTFKIN